MFQLIFAVPNSESKTKIDCQDSRFPEKLRLTFSDPVCLKYLRWSLHPQPLEPRSTAEHHLDHHTSLVQMQRLPAGILQALKNLQHTACSCRKTRSTPNCTKLAGHFKEAAMLWKAHRTTLYPFQREAFRVWFQLDVWELKVLPSLQVSSKKLLISFRCIINVVKTSNLPPSLQAQRGFILKVPDDRQRSIGALWTTWTCFWETKGLCWWIICDLFKQRPTLWPWNTETVRETYCQKYVHF